jgi:hypothetical protein
MTALQLIIKKAKALRAASPKKFAKWTDYVKAASATIKQKKKATVGAVKNKAVKKAAKKKVIKKTPVKKIVKKTAPKKTTSIHKDTKSHNVRINVVSGTKKLKYRNSESEKINTLKKIQNSIEFIKLYDENINFWKKEKPKDILSKNLKINELKGWKNLKATEKKTIQQLKKLIN